MYNLLKQIFRKTNKEIDNNDSPIPDVCISSLDEYQFLAERTCPDLGTLEKNNLHMIAGVFTELGETVDVYKKHLAYKKQLDIINISEEISDACWYLVNYARINGLDLPDLTAVRTYRLFSKPSFKNEWEIADELLLITSYFLRNPKTNYYKTIQKLYIISGIIYDMSGSNMFFYKGLENNIKKLMVRYPVKFDEFFASNRQLDIERQTLES